MFYENYHVFRKVFVASSLKCTYCGKIGVPVCFIETDSNIYITLILTPSSEEIITGNTLQKPNDNFIK